MKYSKDLVSVIMPTYKRSDMLGRAIKSVLNQSHKNLELLVVSDNEPDDEFTNAALETIKGFHDSRVRLIIQKHHTNGAVARNVGIKESKGEFISFLDDDDWWESRKIELQLDLLKSLDNSFGAVTCKNKHYFNGKIVTALPSIRDGNVCKDLLLRLVDLSTDAILLRRSCLDETGYFDENLSRHQEVQLMAFFTQKFKVKLLDMYLVCVDSTKNENQPDPERMEIIKRDFWRSVSPVINSFSDKEIKHIKAMHQFELGLLFIKNRQVKIGVEKCSSILKSPHTINYAFKYMWKKISSKIFVQKRINKDAYTILNKRK